MADLRIVKGKRPHTHNRGDASEEVRVVFIPVDGEIRCVEAATFYPVQIQQPVAVTIPRAALGYVPPER